ncbi:mitochondrial GTPase 1 [Agrilus planipennis]|uniref:Mitochondrial GTPase 1 n=1 Tax=Agrilus planipennis TaxID=224129 RepID=A0A1W4WF05_AGRPL|nr:mitochondrial GTPase 1 [Agrilus planipennis]XP_018318693.1 mitochondrial GTPase 1 [Agrilus planipennis]
MAQKCTETFRSTFGAIDKQLLRWFPGHMDRGLKQMQQKLKMVDCIIEVHDARIPFTGRNTNFKYTVSGIKPHVLVLNKVDMIEKRFLPLLQKRLRDENEHVLFTNCKDQSDSSIKKLFSLVQKLINSSDRYNREGDKDYNVMIIGVPNVGKSSLINKLRNIFLNRANAAAVGAAPGITRSVQTKIKICDDPLFFLFDTPGITIPKVDNAEVWLKLALCAIVQDHLVGEPIIADYLLYWLNKQNKLNYVEAFNLEGATDDILNVLVQIAKQQNKVLKMRNTNNEYVIKPDLTHAAKYVIKSFRNGTLGNIMLDEDLL